MLQRLLPFQLGQAGLPMLSCTCRSYASAAASMSLIKDLREKSGAPISDVKSALVEANWDPGTFYTYAWRLSPCVCPRRGTSSSAADSAYQNLRKKGLAAASKKVVTACLSPQHRPLLCCTYANSATTALTPSGGFRSCHASNTNGPAGLEASCRRACGDCCITA